MAKRRRKYEGIWRNRLDSVRLEITYLAGWQEYQIVERRARPRSRAAWRVKPARVRSYLTGMTRIPRPPER